MTGIRKIVFVLTAALLAVATSAPVFSGEPRPNCVRVEHPGKGAYMRNVCDQRVYVVWCVENPKSAFKCNPQGRGYGAAEFAPGQGGPIVDYAYDGGGRVWVAVCTTPGMVKDWKGAASQYTCTAR